MFINVCCRISEQRTTSLNSLNSVSPAAKCSGLPPRCVPAVHILGCQQFTDSLQVSAATGLEQLPAALAGPQTNTGLDQLCHHRPGDTAPPPRPAHLNISGWTTCTAVIGLVSVSDCRFWRVWSASSRRRNPRTLQLLRPCRTMRPRTRS